MKRLFSKLFLGSTLLALSFVPAANAVVTQKVDHDTFAEFSAGEFDNISLTGDGHLELAPAVTNLASITDPIIWCSVQDANGNIFFGSGNDGKVYKLTSKGELSTFFAPNEVMVHALAIDGKGRLYAATSPNGRVYRLDADGHAEVFCSPGEAYIWAMTFGKDGALYLATGNHGKILRVAATDSAPAQAETYFETGESHISSLAWDKDGNLLAGTSPHGYLFRIDKTNHGFVLFNSGDTEIKQITVEPDGTIFASTFVGKSGSEPALSAGPMTISISSAEDENSNDSAAKSAAPANAPSAVATDDDDGLPNGGLAMIAAMNSGALPGAIKLSQGGIYRIDTNGFYERYWSAPDEPIYSMILLPDGNLLVGAGGKGRIYSVSSPTQWKLLQKTSDGAQVSTLLSGAAGSKQYYATTSHPGKLYRLDFALAAGGVYTSKAFDAKQKSVWGKIHPDGAAPDGTQLEFSTRSGNTEKPEKTWSDWSDPKPLASEISVASPSARYLQYRVTFTRDKKDSSQTAQLRRLQFYYQNENAAPVISLVKVYTEGFGISKLAAAPMEAPVNLGQLLNPEKQPPASESVARAAFQPFKVTKGPGLCTVVWSASDPNDDDLDFSVAIRAESETNWTTLVDKTEDNFYSFDTTGFREGVYFVKVTASDKSSNTPDTALTAEAASEAFLIDNTSPVLTVKKQEVEKDRASIVVSATDSLSVINSATYSLDGKDDVNLRPDDLIFDSTNETFTIELSDLPAGAHSLLLRVQNEANNTAVLKLNFETE